MENAESNPNREARKASTKDIIGPSPDVDIDPRWQEHYRALMSLRESILSQQRDLLGQAAEESTRLQRNLAELGTDEYDREFALGMASSEQETLYEIDQALNRIRTSTYGTCELTGKPIQADRLKSIPWTRFSAEAERRLEAEGQIRRARLGELEELAKRQKPPPG